MIARLNPLNVCLDRLANFNYLLLCLLGIENLQTCLRSCLFGFGVFLKWWYPKIIQVMNDHLGMSANGVYPQLYPFSRDNDQQNHWVFRGTNHFQTNPFWYWNANHGDLGIPVWYFCHVLPEAIPSTLAVFASPLRGTTRDPSQPRCFCGKAKKHGDEGKDIIPGLVNVTKKRWIITIFNGKTHYKLQFSIAMLVCQRVLGISCYENGLINYFLWLLLGKSTINGPFSIAFCKRLPERVSLNWFTSLV